MKCIKCEKEKPIGVKGVCLSCLSSTKPSAAPVEINAVDPAKLAAALAKPKRKAFFCEVCRNNAEHVLDNGEWLCCCCDPALLEEPEIVTQNDYAKINLKTNGIANKPSGKLLICDKCQGQFKSLVKFNKLDLCGECLSSEQLAALELAQTVQYDRANYKTWPRCSECQAHVVKENLDANDGVCTNCARKKNKIGPLELVKPTDSNKYQEFFNAKTQSIVEMLKELGNDAGILQLRQNIIDGDELLDKQEAAAFKTKCEQQAQKVKFNMMLAERSLDEQKTLRIEDSSYKPKSGEPRKLKSPLLKDADKVKKLKKSLDEQINAMFGGVLSQEEIEQKKKALGM